MQWLVTDCEVVFRLRWVHLSGELYHVVGNCFVGYLPFFSFVSLKLFSLILSIVVESKRGKLDVTKEELENHFRMKSVCLSLKATSISYYEI